MLPLLIGGTAEAHHDSIEGLWNLVDEILDARPTGNAVRIRLPSDSFGTTEMTIHSRGRRPQW
jgi:hypothetical protein